MRIQIITPQVEGVRTGNFSSAEQWRAILNSLGHEIRVSSHYLDEPADWLIGLHALKGAKALADCRRQHPETKIAL